MSMLPMDLFARHNVRMFCVDKHPASLLLSHPSGELEGVERVELLFEFTGDQNAIRHCLYYCKAARGSIEGETKGETVEVKTEELTFKASPLPDSEIIKAKTGANTDSDRYDAWYSAVSLPDLSGSE